MSLPSDTTRAKPTRPTAERDWGYRATADALRKMQTAEPDWLTEPLPFFQPILQELARASRRPVGPKKDSMGHLRVFQGKDAWHIGIVIDGGHVGIYDESRDGDIVENWHQQLVDLIDGITRIREGRAS
jgi:hypothetical protein